MKKTIASILVIAGFLPVVAMARVITVPAGQLDCETGIVTDNLGATSTHSTNLCKAGNGNPENVVGPWGFTNSQLPRVEPGASVKDAAGLLSFCPLWFGRHLTYCVDISGTEYYKGLSRIAAQQISGQGFAPGPWAYWLAH